MEKEATVSSRPPRLSTQGFRQSNSCAIGKELWHWYCTTRTAKGGKLSKAMVQARAKWAFHQAGMVDFKASDGWYKRWIHRWRNSNTSFETENVVQVQQTEQTRQTDWELSQHSSKQHLKPEFIETESSALSSSNIQTDVNNLPSSSAAFVDAQDFADTQSNIVDSCRDISDNSSKSEEEMFEYWSTFLNCNTNFGNIDSDLTQNCMEFFTNPEDSNFPIDVDELAAVFLDSHGQFASENNPSHRHSLSDCRIHRKRGERYLPRFKEKVLSYISSHSIKMTAEKFGIHQETVTRWKNAKTANSVASSSDALVAESKNSADKQLLAWLRRCRVRQISFTPDELHNKVNQLIGKGNNEASPRWFVMWTERLGKELKYEEGMELLDRQTKLIQYPEAFKREVAAIAENKSQQSVAKLFSVSRRRVLEWTQIFGPKLREVEAASEENEDQFDCSKKKKKKKRIQLTVQEIDEQLWTWYQSQTPRPNSNQVRAKGLELYHSKGLLSISCSHGWYRRWSARYNMALSHGADDQILQWALAQLEANQTLTHQSVQVYALNLLGEKQAGFKASSGWVLRFCRRHPFLLQMAPTLSTPLPPPLLVKVDRFRQLIRSTIQTRSLAPGSIGNVDELHISFASLASEVSSTKKRPLLRRSSMDKCHATIVLACLSDGNMLPPAVILKGNPNDIPPESATSNLLVLYQDQAQLDERCMLQWLASVWFQYVPTPNLLIADCYPPHCTPAAKQEFSSHDSMLKVISGGCASRLQPLDVAIKDIFRNLIEKQWKGAIAQPSSGLGSPWENVGKFEMPSVSNILQWVNSAYENIQTTKQETIRRSYLVTGLTVSPNHTEDHFIDNMSMMPRNVDE